MHFPQSAFQLPKNSNTPLKKNNNNQSLKVFVSNSIVWIQTRFFFSLKLRDICNACYLSLPKLPFPGQQQIVLIPLLQLLPLEPQEEPQQPRSVLCSLSVTQPPGPEGDNTVTAPPKQCLKLLQITVLHQYFQN